MKTGQMIYILGVIIIVIALLCAGFLLFDTAADDTNIAPVSSTSTQDEIISTSDTTQTQNIIVASEADSNMNASVDASYQNIETAHDFSNFEQILREIGEYTKPAIDN